MFLGRSKDPFTVLVVALLAVGVACLYGSWLISNARIARIVQRLGFVALFSMAACFVISLLVALHDARS